VDILQETTLLKMYHYPLFGVTIIMPPRNEDEKVKAFVQALTLALLHIVGKPPGSTGTKRQSPKSKKIKQHRKKKTDHNS
jgi:hypothetical protein